MSNQLEGQGKRVRYQPLEVGFKRASSPDEEVRWRRSWRRKGDRNLLVALVDKLWYQYRMSVKARNRAASKTGKPQ